MATNGAAFARRAGRRSERTFACPVEATLHVIGPKWTIVLIYKLLDGSQRYGELRRRVPAVSEKMLAQQLRRLESHGIVQREVIASVPPQVRYSLTPKGTALAPVLERIADWGLRHSGLMPQR